MYLSAVDLRNAARAIFPSGLPSRIKMIEKPFVYRTEIREPKGFADIETAIDELRAGRIIVVVDDEDRENEGDLKMAAPARKDGHGTVLGGDGLTESAARKAKSAREVSTWVRANTSVERACASVRCADVTSRKFRSPYLYDSRAAS